MSTELEHIIKWKNNNEVTTSELKALVLHYLVVSRGQIPAIANVGIASLLNSQTSLVRRLVQKDAVANGLRWCNYLIVTIKSDSLPEELAVRSFAQMANRNLLDVAKEWEDDSPLTNPSDVFSAKLLDSNALWDAKQVIERRRKTDDNWRTARESTDRLPRKISSPRAAMSYMFCTVAEDVPRYNYFDALDAVLR